jgi:hypothetical protein
MRIARGSWQAAADFLTVRPLFRSGVMSAQVDCAAVSDWTGDLRPPWAIFGGAACQALGRRGVYLFSTSDPLNLAPSEFTLRAPFRSVPRDSVQ